MSVSDLGVFDLQHASRLDQIDAALAALGRRLVVTSENRLGLADSIDVEREREEHRPVGLEIPAMIVG